MKNISVSLFFIFFVLSSVIADDKKKSETFLFNNVVIPEAPPVAAVMVAYMNIVNNSGKKQTITKIDSPQFKRVEIHNMTMKDGMMKMQQMTNVSIKKNKSLSLKPGGLHIMLIKPLKRLQRSEPITLKFKLLSGESVIVKTTVQFTD